MTTAQQIPENVRKLAVYDADGNILLKESIDRLIAQLGGTPEVKKSKQRFPDTIAKPVREIATGKEWPSQAKMAVEIHPGALTKEGKKNNIECYNIYKEFPGRFEVLKDGVWVVQMPKVTTPVVPTAETSAEGK